MSITLQFLISAIVIIFCGLKLTRYADVLSDRLNLGKAWVGVLLLGFITSLPEALTCLWSVVTLQAYDLAIGNVLGSNIFNPLIIVLLDGMTRNEVSISHEVKTSRSHGWSARCVVWLSVIVFAEILLGQYIAIPSVGPISIGTLLIIGTYLFGMYGVYQYDQKEKPSAPTEKSPEDVKYLYLKLLATAALVVVAAINLTNACDVIADATGLGRTFIGSLLLAFVTSLPEIVVSVSAIRLGAMDLAIGNIFGSNMTNIAIIALCAFFTKGPILSLVEPVHVITLGASLVMITLAIFLVRRPIKKIFFNLTWVSLAMIITFLSGAGLLYFLK